MKILILWSVVNSQEKKFNLSLIDVQPKSSIQFLNGLIRENHNISILPCNLFKVIRSHPTKAIKTRLLLLGVTSNGWWHVIFTSLSKLYFCRNLISVDASGFIVWPSIRWQKRLSARNRDWAGPWETYLMLYANNKGADQPAYPRSLISAFVVRCLDSVMSLVYVTKISSLMLASVLSRPVWVWPGRKLPKTRFLMTRLRLLNDVEIATWSVTRQIKRFWNIAFSVLMKKYGSSPFIWTRWMRIKKTSELDFKSLCLTHTNTFILILFSSHFHSLIPHYHCFFIYIKEKSEAVILTQSHVTRKTCLQGLRPVKTQTGLLRWCD